MNYTIIIIAGFGGLLINLLSLLEVAVLPKDRRPDFTDPLYWMTYPIYVLLGAGLVYIYILSGDEIKPIMALHLGASSPLILRAMTSAIPNGFKPQPGA